MQFYFPAGFQDKGGHRMDRLVEDLLNIENAAKESLKVLEEEQAALPQRITDEVTRRSSDIRRKADQTIRTLQQEAETVVLAEIAEIKDQYRRKAAQINDMFDANKAEWRKEWAARVLQRG